jgi:hypothetical protein
MASASLTDASALFLVLQNQRKAALTAYTDVVLRDHLKSKRRARREERGWRHALSNGRSAAPHVRVDLALRTASAWTN